MRRHLTLPTALSLIALLVAMSGTAVAATLLITRNKQVAAHTIAGAAAPNGDNKNIIAGSIGSSDLANGSVGLSKLDFPSFNSNAAASPDTEQPVTEPLGSGSGFTLSYTCVLNSTTGAVTLDLQAKSSVTGATFNGVPLAAESVSVDTLDAPTAESANKSGFETYLNGKQVTPVFLELQVHSAGTAGTCHVDGVIY